MPDGPTAPDSTDQGAFDNSFKCAIAGSGEAFQDEAGATVWTLKDLRILHEIQKPIAVIVAGVYEDPHRQVILYLEICSLHLPATF